MTATEARKHIQKIHYGLEFGPKWGPGATRKARGKRKIEEDDSGTETEVPLKVGTKVYEKKSVLAENGSVPDK